MIITVWRDPVARWDSWDRYDAFEGEHPTRPARPHGVYLTGPPGYIASGYTPRLALWRARRIINARRWAEHHQTRPALVVDIDADRDGGM